MPKKRKLTKAQRAAAMRNLKKARRARFKVKRVGKKRFGPNKGAKVKVLTVKEATRPYRARGRYRVKRVGKKRYGPNKGAKIKVLTVKEAGRRSRKRRTTAKQRAAARRNIRKAQAALRHRNRGRRRNPLPNPMSKAARSRAAKKAWRTRKANMAAGRKAAPRKRTKRYAYKAAAKRRSSLKRARMSLAKREAAYRADVQRRLAARRARHAAKARSERVKTHPYGEDVAIFEERRRRRRRRNPLPLVGVLANPIGRPMQFLGKAVGLGFGYLWEDAVIRFAATHALNGTGVNLTDSPPAGQIYNSEAPLLPIWSDMTKLGLSVAGVAVPLFAGRFFMRDFMNHAFIAAAVRLIGKVAVDAASMLPQALPSTGPAVLRLYGGEIAAQTRLAQVNTSPAATAPAGSFAGVPRSLGAPVPRQLGCGDCGGDGSSQQVMSDPLAGAQAMLAGAGLQPGMGGDCGCSVNLNAGFQSDTSTSSDGSMPMTPAAPAASAPVVTPQPSVQTQVTPQPAPPMAAATPAAAPPPAPPAVSTSAPTPGPRVMTPVGPRLRLPSNAAYSYIPR